PMPVWRRNMTLAQALRSWYMLFFQIPRLPEWLMSASDYALVERVFKRTVARPGTFTDADIAVYKKALGEPGALTAAVNYYRANFFSLFLKGRRRPEEMGDGRVRVPTLFIYGEEDHAIVPETVRGVKDFIDAPYRELRIKTSAHWVQNEAAEEVNAALLSFLASP
ncbi:MAG: alpha/beta hydrolase, partial [Acidobacteria bacterium]|nr:alpha/beta hydrolase [Acidobacteriota bacterium]